MCIAVKRALIDETRKQNKPKPVDQEAAAVADPLKITGVGAAASQSPAVKAATTPAKKTKPVNSGLQVGTPY